MRFEFLGCLGALSVLLATACSSHPRAKDPPPPESLSLPACPLGSSKESCFPGPLKAPPVVAGPGRIRALVLDREAPAKFLTPEGFSIIEITDTGFSPIARGLCPLGSRAESLGQVASGRSTVLCRSPEGLVHVGSLRDSGDFEWRFKLPIQLAPSEKLQPSQVPLFADLGERVALLFAAPGSEKAAVARWSLQLGPETTKPIPLCAANEACPIVALLVENGNLHVLFGSGEYKDLMVATTGLTAVADPLQSAELRPGELAEPCVSQARDGKVTVQLPFIRSAPGATPDAPPVREALIATLSYEHAWLPHGPEVFPTELGSCGPRVVRENSAEDAPISLREGVRASYDQRWLLVYGLPEIPAKSYRQRLLPKQKGQEAAYPGSVRVLRGSEVSARPSP
ncbi:MAG TPA: hypothetical protein VG937_30795 [Polyangiaceae bacterium]|nr:hypothetical protein [Polyangiaceae bacterium]